MLELWYTSMLLQWHPVQVQVLDQAELLIVIVVIVVIVVLWNQKSVSQLVSQLVSDKVTYWAVLDS